MGRDCEESKAKNCFDNAPKARAVRCPRCRDRKSTQPSNRSALSFSHPPPPLLSRIHCSPHSAKLQSAGTKKEKNNVLAADSFTMIVEKLWQYCTDGRQRERMGEYVAARWPPDLLYYSHSCIIIAPTACIPENFLILRLCRSCSGFCCSQEPCSCRALIFVVILLRLLKLKRTSRDWMTARTSENGGVIEKERLICDSRWRNLDL